MSYWDTSAVIKLYLDEPDSEKFRGIAATVPRIMISTLTWSEARVTFRRKEADGSLAKGATEQLMRTLFENIEDGRINSMMWGELLEPEAERVIDRCWTRSPCIRVRTLDAIHIASALTAGETIFVTADIRQRDAAAACGLSLWP